MKLREIINKKAEATFETDVDVPIAIQYNNYIPGPNDFLFEYQIFNKSNSFIEICLNNNQNEIKSITLMTIKNINCDLPISFDDILSIEGTPIIDIDEEDWKVLSYCRILEIKNDFKLYYASQRFIVLFEGYSNIIKKVKMPYAELLVNDNNDIAGLIIYDIPDVTSFEKNILNQS